MNELGRLSTLVMAGRHTWSCELFKATGAVDLTSEKFEERDVLTKVISRIR